MNSRCLYTDIKSVNQKNIKYDTNVASIGKHPSPGLIAYYCPEP